MFISKAYHSRGFSGERGCGIGSHGLSYPLPVAFARRARPDVEWDRDLNGFVFRAGAYAASSATRPPFLCVCVCFFVNGGDKTAHGVEGK